METGPRATMVLPVHRLTPWFRVRISTGEDWIATEHWQALLGFIPLRRRRIELAFENLGSFRISRSTVRTQCLLAAAASVTAILVLHPPILTVVVLSIFAFLQLVLGLPNAALRIEATDGRAWTVRFCRDYAFDISLAFEDAAQRRDRRLPGVA